MGGGCDGGERTSLLDLTEVRPLFFFTPAPIIFFSFGGSVLEKALSSTLLHTSESPGSNPEVCQAILLHDSPDQDSHIYFPSK